MKEKYDYIVVGTGIGGGTLISELTKFSNDILVVEAGNLKHNSPNYISKGRDFGLRSTSSIQLGGTSNLWHGVLSFLDDIDFKQRDWIKGSKWPITLDDLMPYYKKISKSFGIKDFEYFFENKLPEDLNNELKSIPFNRNILNNKLFQQPLNILNYKHKLLKLYQSKKITLLQNSKVCKLNIDNGKAISVVIGTDNKLYDVSANNIIICSGALESPRILQNSNVNNPIIGKYLMDHPMGNLCQVKFKKPRKAQIYSAKKYNPHIAIKTGLTFSLDIQKKHKIPNHCFYLRPSFSQGINNKSEKIKLSLLAFKDGKISLKDIFYVLSNINIAFQILTYKLSYNATYKFADLFFVSEQTPTEDSFVRLSKDKKDEYGYPLAEINWNISKSDVESVEKCYEILKKEGFSNEDFEFTHKFEDIDWSNNFTSAAHHVGTCRMAENENDGVVDKNLKVFGIDNLYICDGSIFRTGGNVNNGFTIAAFATRLAEHLKTKK